MERFVSGSLYNITWNPVCFTTGYVLARTTFFLIVLSIPQPYNIFNISGGKIQNDIDRHLIFHFPLFHLA